MMYIVTGKTKENDVKPDTYEIINTLETVHDEKSPHILIKGVQDQVF